MKQLSLRHCLAAGVALLGAAVLIGWLAHAPAVARILPNLAAMSMATAFSFVVAGISLLSPLLWPTRVYAIRVTTGAFLLAISLAMLVENVANVDLGIDLASMQAWLDPANAHPGRMAFNTALGFLLCGVCVVAMRKPLTSITAGVTGVAVWALIAIGVFGLAGHMFGTEYIYRWYGYASMALATAVGMTTLGFALKSYRRHLIAANSAIVPAADARITATAAGWLAAVALTAGVAGFVVMQQQAERTINDTLLLALRQRVELFDSILSLRTQNMTFLGTRPALLGYLRRLAMHPDDREAREAVSTIAASFLPGGFSAVAIFDANAIQVARVGSFADRVQVSQPIAGDFDSVLLWQDGYILRNHIILSDKDGIVGSAFAEQPLPILTRSIGEVASLGVTGDTGVCGDGGDSLHCFPTRLRPEPFNVAKIVAGQELPVTRALQGRSGVVRTVDYRGQSVVAAFAPIGTTGLGTALKLDSAEIYQPVRDRVALFGPILIAMVVAGALALRSQLKPMAAELVRSQASLRAQSAELAQSNQDLKYALLAKDRFLAAMSHELRTPLNGILGFTGTLLMRLAGPLTPDQEKHLGIIRQSGKHLLSLINDLLDLAKLESGQFAVSAEPVIAQEVIRQLMDTLRPAAEGKGLRLSLQAPDADVAIDTDRRALLQILMNLTNNAIKYTAEGSVVVELAARQHGAQETIEFNVIDTGCGISDEDKADLFRAFGQVGDRRGEREESTGLGLYLSQKLASLIGGNITLRSRLGGGSTFTLSLPRHWKPSGQ